MLRRAPEESINWGLIAEKVETAGKSGLLKAEEVDGMLDVLRIGTLQQLLLRDPTAVQLLEDVAAMTSPRPHLLDRLRKLTMSIWLDHINTLAITPEGKLLVDIRGGDLCIDPSIADERNARYRQAILRQTERHAVMDACGLLYLPDKGGRALRILDAGAGTCINSVMMRQRYPTAVITAVDPGVLVPKTNQLVDAHSINYVHGEIADVAQGDFDAIVLQFVLEHDRAASKAILRDALRKLNKDGILTIAVPNYNAFHRELETAIGKNGRDAITRLSGLDFMVGHQIIFSEEELVGMIREVMAEEGVALPIHAQTILPRPFAFNTLVALDEQKSLWTLEHIGAPRGFEGKGSVLCITVGHEPVATLPKERDEERACREFQRMILAEMTRAHGRSDIRMIGAMVRHLRRDHWDLFDREGIQALIASESCRDIIGSLLY